MTFLKKHTSHGLQSNSDSIRTKMDKFGQIVLLDESAYFSKLVSYYESALY